MHKVKNLFVKDSKDEVDKPKSHRRKRHRNRLEKGLGHDENPERASEGQVVDSEESKIEEQSIQHVRNQAETGQPPLAGLRTQNEDAATDPSMLGRLKGHGVERSTFPQAEKDERYDEGFHPGFGPPVPTMKDLPEVPTGPGRRTPTIPGSTQRRPVAANSSAISRSARVDRKTPGRDQNSSEQRSVTPHEGDRMANLEHDEDEHHIAKLRAKHAREIEGHRRQFSHTRQGQEGIQKYMQEVHKAEMKLLEEKLLERQRRLTVNDAQFDGQCERPRDIHHSDQMVDAKTHERSRVRYNFEKSCENHVPRSNLQDAMYISENSTVDTVHVDKPGETRLDEDPGSEISDEEIESPTSSIHERQYHALTSELDVAKEEAIGGMESQQTRPLPLNTIRKHHQDEDQDQTGDSSEDLQRGKKNLNKSEEVSSTQNSLALLEEAEKSLKLMEETLSERDEQLRLREVDHQAGVQSIANKHQEELQNVQISLKAELSALSEKYAAVLDANTKLGDREKEYTATQAAWEEEKQKMHIEHRGKMQEQEERHEQESVSVAKDVKNHMERVVKGHEQSEFKLKRGHEADMNKLKEDRDKQVKRITTEGEAAVQKMTATLTAQKTSSIAEQSKLRAEIARLEIRLDDERQKHQREQSTLKAEVTAIRKKLNDERQVNDQEQSILSADKATLKQTLKEERQQYVQDQSAWELEKKNLINLHRGELSRQAAKHLKALDDDQADFDHKLRKITDDFNQTLAGKSVIIAKQKKTLSDTRAKSEKDQLLSEQAHRDAIRELREEHDDHMARTKDDHGTHVSGLNRDHKVAIEQVEEKLRQHKAAATSALEKYKQDSVARLKNSEDTAAEKLAKHERTAAATLRQQAQDAAEKLDRQLELNGEQRLQFEATLTSLEEKHHKASEQWQSDTIAAHAHLKAEIQARNKALIARETSRSHTDGELKSLFLGIIDDVDSLARLKWTFNKSPWTDDLQKELSDSPKRLRKQILQETIWGVLHEQIFGSPFRMLGEEGKRLEVQWVKDFGNVKTSSKLGDGTYIWPKASFPSERWRYETLRQLEDAIKNPISEYDPRQKLLSGFQESLSSACKEIYDGLEQVTEIDEKTIVTIKNLVEKAANMWIMFGAQRCRLVVAMTDLKVTTESCNPQVGGERSVELVARPELRRFGDTDGALYDSVAKISGCEGEMIRILY